VRKLKILLPILAAVISAAFIVVSIIRTYLPESLSVESARIENGKIVMERPAISGRNKDGINYSMIANRALQDIQNPNMISLEDVKAAVPINDDVIARVTTSVAETAASVNITRPALRKIATPMAKSTASASCSTPTPTARTRSCRSRSRTARSTSRS
jgi:lipopolysaccharide export system protein LptC